MYKKHYILFSLLLASVLFVTIRYYHVIKTHRKTDPQETMSYRPTFLIKDANDKLRMLLLKNPTLAQEVDSLIESKPYLKDKKQQFILEYYKKPIHGVTVFLDFMKYKQINNKRQTPY